MYANVFQTFEVNNQNLHVFSNTILIIYANTPAISSSGLARLVKR